MVRLPRISNFTDIDALAAEPGVLIRLAREPAELADADLVVLPGSRATVADLGWLRERGLAAAIAERARAGLPVLGICGGYQMLAGQIEDRVESGAGEVPGLGLLPARVEFGADKCLGRPVGRALGATVAGYEIHHGVVRLTDPGCEPFLDGCRAGPVARCGARAGMARWKTTSSGGCSWPRWRAWPVAISRPRPARTSRGCARRGSTRSATWSPTTSIPRRSRG